MQEELSKTLNLLSFFILLLLSSVYFLALGSYFESLRIVPLTILAGSVVMLGIFDASWGNDPGVKKTPFKLIIISLTIAVNFWLNMGNGIGLQTISLVWLLIAYHLSYKLAYWSKEVSWSDGVSEGNLGHYRGLTLFGLKKLKEQFIKIDIFVALIWIIRWDISLLVISIGILIFLLQFIFLGIAFYQKRRAYWESYNYIIDPKLFKNILIGISIVVLIIGLLGIAIPTKYNLVPFQAVRSGMSRLGEGIQIRGGDYGETIESLNRVPTPGEMEISVEDGGEVSPFSMIFLFAGALTAIGVLLLLSGTIIYIIKFGIDNFIEGVKVALKKGPTAIISLIKSIYLKLLSLLSYIKKKIVIKKNKVVKNNISESKAEDKSYGLSSRKSYEQDQFRDEAVRIFHKTLEWASQKGLSKREDETIGEFFSKIKGVDILGDEALVLQGIFEFAFYDKGQVEELEIIKAKKILNGLNSSSS